MRTTIRLDDELLAQAKARAAESRRSLNEFIEQAVRARLAAESKATPPAGPLPTFRGKGLRAGVDVNDGANLLEQMEADA